MKEIQEIYNEMAHFLIKHKDNKAIMSVIRNPFNQYGFDKAKYYIYPITECDDEKINTLVAMMFLMYAKNILEKDCKNNLGDGFEKLYLNSPNKSTIKRFKLIANSDNSIQLMQRLRDNVVGIFSSKDICLDMSYIFWDLYKYDTEKEDIFYRWIKSFKSINKGE